MRKFLSIFIAALMIFSLTAAVNPVAAADMGMHITTPSAGATITTTSFAVQGTFDTAQSGDFKLYVWIGSNPVPKEYSFSLASSTTIWGPITVSMSDFSGAVVAGNTYTLTLQATKFPAPIPPVMTDTLVVYWTPSTTPPPVTSSYISLTRGTSSDTGTYTYTMGEYIVGTIVPVGGASLPANVLLKNNYGSVVISVPVDSYGNFSIPTIQVPLSEGTYTVDAGIATASVYLKYGIESVSPSTAPTIGSTNVPVMGRLFYGNITKTGVGGVTVAVFDPNSTMVASTTTWPDGSFIMYANFAIAGKYRLRVGDGYLPDFIANYFTWSVGPSELSVNLAVNPTLIYSNGGDQTFTLYIADPTTGAGVPGLSISNFSHSAGVTGSLVTVTDIGSGFYNVTVNPGSAQGPETFKVATTSATGSFTITYQPLGDWNPQLYIIPDASGLVIGTKVQFVYTAIPNAASSWFVKYTSSDSGPTGDLLVNPDYPDDFGVRTIQFGGQIKYHENVLLWNSTDPLATKTKDLTQDFTIYPTVSGDVVEYSPDSVQVGGTSDVTVTVSMASGVEANNRKIVLKGATGIFKYPAPSGAIYTVSADGSTVTLDAITRNVNIVGGKYVFAGLTFLKTGYIDIEVYRGTATSTTLTADLIGAIEVTPKVVTLTASVEHFVLGEDLYRSVKVSGAVTGLSFDPAALDDNGDGSYTFSFTPADINNLKYVNAEGKTVVTIEAYSADGNTLYTIDIPVVKPVLEITSVHKDGLITKGIPEVVTFKVLDPDTQAELAFTSPVLTAQYTTWDIYRNLPVSAFMVSGVKTTADQPTNSVAAPVTAVYGNKYLDYTTVTSTVGAKVVVNGVTITFSKVLKIASPSITFKSGESTELKMYYNVKNMFSVTALDAHGVGLEGAEVVGANPYNTYAPYLFGGLTDEDGFAAFTYTPNYMGEIYIDLLSGGSSLLSSSLVIKIVPAPADTTAPTVTISEPADGAKVTSASVVVKGSVTDDVGVTAVYLNDTISVTLKPDGTFAVPVTLVEGSNTIKVTAFDAAGNKAEKSVTVTYELPPAPAVTKIVLKIGSDIMTVNGQAVQLDAAPELKNGKTFLPLRAIAEAFGAQVNWVAETQGITVVLGDTQIGLQIKNNTAVINGNVISIEPPYIKNGRTMVPFRVIAEAFGAKVDWDPVNYIVTVTLQG